MVINKKSQGSPIGLIVAAVIGLIILVVVIAMLGGKLGAFGKGAEDANTCNSLCKALGYDGGAGTGAGTERLRPPKKALPKVP